MIAHWAMASPKMFFGFVRALCPINCLNELVESQGSQYQRWWAEIHSCGVAKVNLEAAFIGGRTFKFSRPTSQNHVAFVFVRDGQ